ncbi:uncharacterized protein LOC135163827 isoform X1 [Diachasmimorpha longicaudata]|uniref:uncharacterized protein LOC135163827 isoform X1 n=2 Tax=Diachasmimorpha longicaudata TaxID=58733 RepID=UPI0030B8DEC1
MSKGSVCTIMGRPPKVQRHQAIQCFIKFMDILQTNDFPVASDKVWREMSKELKEKWTAHSVYTHVRDNKNGCLQEARKICWVTTPPPLSRPRSRAKLDDTLPECSTLLDDSFDPTDHVFELENIDPCLEEFDIFLSPEDWEKIKPENLSEPGLTRLKAGVWPYVISNAFYQRYKIPCAMIAKWSQVRVEENGSFKLSFHAICKSEKCGNVFSGSANEQPVNGKLTLKVRARDTRGQPHEDVKRPLRGSERAEVAQELLKQRPENYRRELLRKGMDFGQSVPPNIRPGNIYRQARYEAQQKLDGILPGDKRDQLTILRDLTADPRYSHIIIELALSPFHLMYCTPEQVYSYREYCRLVKNSIVMADATGSLVKKFEKALGSFTGHIFLYVLTIRFKNKTFPFAQVLADKQDCPFLTYWMGILATRLGLPPPKQALSDQERALLMAHCQVYNGRTIKQYVDDVFTWGCDENNNQGKPFPAPTVIRIDVAHFMAAAARWNCFKDRDKFRAKRFYVRTIALLVDCQSIQEFQLVFLLICLVALMPVNDHGIDLPEKTNPLVNRSIHLGIRKITADQARAKLEQYIALRGLIIDNLQEHSENAEMEITANFQHLPEEISTKKNTLTHQWIKELISLVKPENPETIVGNVENGLYLPPLVVELERIGKEFVLWSSAVLPPGMDKSHASTAAQEGYFNEVKHRLFEGTKLPVSCNRFFRAHVDDISAGVRELGANLIEFAHETFDTCKGMKPEKEPIGENGATKSDQNERRKEKVDRGNPESEKEKKSDWDQVIPEVETESRDEVIADVLEPEPKDEVIPDVLQPESNVVSEDVQFINDSDFRSQMRWRGIKNDKNGFLWQCGDAYIEIEELSQESFGAQLYTQEIDCDIFGLENAELPKLVGGDLLDETHADNNNNQPLIDAKHKTNNSNPSKPESSTPVIEQPQFSSTFLDLNGNDSSQLLEMLLIDQVNGNPRELTPNPHRSSKASRKRKRGGYFEPCPEIADMNRQTSVRKPRHFLQNGLHCPVVKLNGIGIYVINTCAFDSFVHIFLYAVYDNEDYRTMVESSEVGLFKFLTQFLKHGSLVKVLQQRCSLLAAHYELRPSKNSTRLTPVTLNAEDSLANVWQHFFGEPVAKRTTECSNIYCSIGQTTNVPYLIVSHQTICEHGFRNLEKAIEIIHIKQCKKLGCGGLITVTLNCQDTVFIELDVADITRGTSLGCCLEDFPTHLNLGKVYRLIGVIHFEPRHFIAYVRRLQGNWIECDDLKTMSSAAPATTPVRPFGAVYIRS